jgi:hypothetical protein
VVKSVVRTSEFSQGLGIIISSWSFLLAFRIPQSFKFRREKKTENENLNEQVKPISNTEDPTLKGNSDPLISM